MGWVAFGFIGLAAVYFGRRLATLRYGPSGETGPEDADAPVPVGVGPGPRSRTASDAKELPRDES